MSYIFNPEHPEIRYEHLAGVPFIWGKQDCYTLIRRFYKDNFDLDMRDYARPKDFWDLGIELYYDNFHKEGFRLVDVRLDHLLVGDLLFMAFNASTATHAAVYVGGGKIIHQLQDRLSSVDYLRGTYRNNLVATLRHPKVIVPPYPQITLDISEIVR